MFILISLVKHWAYFLLLIKLDFYDSKYTSLLLLQKLLLFYWKHTSQNQTIIFLRFQTCQSALWNKNVTNAFQIRIYKLSNLKYHEWDHNCYLLNAILNVINIK